MVENTTLTSVLSALFVASSVVFWLTAARFFRNLTQPAFLLFFAFSLIVLLALAALAGLLVETFRTFLLISLAASLAILLSFPPAPLTFLAAAGFFPTLLWFFHQIRTAKNLFIKIRIGRLANRPLKNLFTLLAVTLSLAYYDVAAETAQNFQLEIPDKVFNVAAENFLNLAEKNLQGPEQAWQTRELAEEAFERQIPQLRQALLNQGIKNPDELEKELTKMRRLYLAQVQQQMREQLERPGGRNKKVLSYLKENVNRQLNSLVGRYRPFIPLFLASSFFFTFEFFGLIVRSLSLLLTWALFGLLKRSRLVKVETVAKEVETIAI